MYKSHLLSVKNLTIAFHQQQKQDWDLRNVSFDVNNNETIGIVGESGSGKSITALSILQLLNRRQLRKYSGEIFFQGKDLMQMKESELRSIRGNNISMIFQDPMASLNPIHTIFRQVAENIRTIPDHSNRLLNKTKEKALVVKTLNQVGLPNPEFFLNRYPHELSGGEQQRVIIAMSIINHPQLLIADEPTTALDVTVQSKIIKLLQQLKESLKLAMVFVSHDLNLIKKIADRIIIMKDGEVVEENYTESIIKNPRMDYTKELFNNTPTPMSSRKYEGQEILSVKDLSIHYTIKSSILKRTINKNVAVNNLSFKLVAGRTLGIIGESGSGKSTLLMAILKLLPYSGEIFFQGRNITTLKSSTFKDLRQQIQIVFQDSYSSLNPRFNIAEIIAEGLDIHFPKMSYNEKCERVTTIMHEVGLDPKWASRYPHEFSGGQRQRINIARALILNPSLVLLDEPTSSLDVTLQKQIIDFLHALQEKKKLTYIFVSHDLRVIEAIADQVIVMKNGEVIETGFTREVFDNPQKNYTKSLIEIY